MTEDELSELVEEHRAFAKAHEPGQHDAMVAFHSKTADAIESLRASLANAERRAEDAEARNVFLETEFLALAEKVKKP